MEIHLDREIVDRRIFPNIFPGIDIKDPGTSKEELLVDKEV